MGFSLAVAYGLLIVVHGLPYLQCAGLITLQHVGS